MAKDGRTYRYSEQLDSSRQYLTDDLDVEGLVSIFRQIDDGDLAASVELQEEMEAKDIHLQGACARRREALTALDWDIEPDLSDPTREEQAKEAAEYCTYELEGMDTFPVTLEHLSTAIGPGLAVTEKVIGQGRILYTVDVPGSRYTAPPDNSPGVHIITEDELQHGVWADPIKFAVYTPHVRSGFATRVTLTRALGLIHLLKHYGISDWAAFAEKYGMPSRVGKLPQGASSDDRQKLIDMLKFLGTDGHAVFAPGTEIELLEASKSSEPYSAMIEWTEKKQSIGLLGQTLTTDIGEIGSRAAAVVHENVKAHILLSDVRQERRMIRESFLRPIVDLRWPGQDMPVPHWVRDMGEARNLDEERLDMDKLSAAVTAGLPLDTDVKYDLLRLPMPREGNAQPEPAEGGDDVE